MYETTVQLSRPQQSLLSLGNTVENSGRLKWLKFVGQSTKEERPEQRKRQRQMCVCVYTHTMYVCRETEREREKERDREEYCLNSWDKLALD